MAARSRPTTTARRDAAAEAEAAEVEVEIVREWRFRTRDDAMRMAIVVVCGG